MRLQEHNLLRILEAHRYSHNDGVQQHYGACHYSHHSHHNWHQLLLVPSVVSSSRLFDRLKLSSDDGRKHLFVSVVQPEFLPGLLGSGRWCSFLSRLWHIATCTPSGTIAWSFTSDSFCSVIEGPTIRIQLSSVVILTRMAVIVALYLRLYHWSIRYQSFVRELSALIIRRRTTFNIS